MKKNLLFVVLALMFVVAQGCSGDDGLSKEEAGKVFAAASTAAGQVQGEVWTGMGQQPGKADQVTVGNYTFEWDENSFSFSGEATSAEGGKATVSGEGNFDETAETAYFSFTMTFIGWVSQGITLDGSLEMTFEGGQNYYKLTYDGDVDSSGQVEGNASFNLTMEMTETGITYSGTVGGQKIGGSVDYSAYGV